MNHLTSEHKCPSTLKREKGVLPEEFNIVQKNDSVTVHRIGSEQYWDNLKFDCCLPTAPKFAVCQPKCLDPKNCTEAEIASQCDHKFETLYGNAGVGSCRDINGKRPATGILRNLNKKQAMRKCESDPTCVALSAIHSKALLKCETTDEMEKQKKYTAKYIYRYDKRTGKKTKYENYNYRPAVVKRILTMKDRFKYVCTEKEENTERRDWEVFCSKIGGICNKSGTGSTKDVWELENFTKSTRTNYRVFGWYI